MRRGQVSESAYSRQQQLTMPPDKHADELLYFVGKYTRDNHYYSTPATPPVTGLDDIITHDLTKGSNTPG